MKRTIFFRRHSPRETGSRLKEAGNILYCNRVLLLLALLLLAGMAAGAFHIGYGDAELLKKLDFLVFSNYQERIVQPGAFVFAASFASTFLFIFACFLCGLSMWGMFFIPFLLFFRGFGLGLTGGHLLVSYGLQGFLFYLSVILPGAFLCFFSILLSGREGITLSKKLMCKDSFLFRTYFIHFGFILALGFLSALLDWGAAFCFAQFFSF